MCSHVNSIARSLDTYAARTSLQSECKHIHKLFSLQTKHRSSLELVRIDYSARHMFEEHMEDNTSSGPLQLVYRLCCILGKRPILCCSKWPSHPRTTRTYWPRNRPTSHATMGTNHNLKTTTTRRSRLNSEKHRTIGYTL